MNIHFQQSERQARLSTELGDDDLALLRFNGTEQVNTLFEFRVEALSKRGDIDFDQLIGTHMSTEVDHPDHGVQPFDGIVTQARFLGVGENGYRYDFELRPWFWLLGKRRNQRIFHEKTVVEILNELLEPYADMGSPSLEMRLQRDYPKLEYTVQFSESDLDFACRMMERFGISYYFQHDQQSHTLIIVDQPSGFDPVPGLRRPFYSASEHRNVEIEHFWEWRPERNFTTGQIRLTDYNFKKPGAKMQTFARGDAEYAHGGIESFDWPGRYLDLGRGEEAEIGLRVTQERGQDRRHYATGDCLTLRAGRRVELSGDNVHAATGEVFACLGARHRYVSNNYSTGAKQTEDTGYSGDYILMPETAPLAPRRKTPLARVHGPQTARVVGEGEIDCDEYGRILVRFHWDLDDAFSMRCRVSQNWAGNGWGGMVIPRIGMEVLVEFLDGDPDKPLVTGCVYNGRNATPYELPKHKTKSVFRSDTHKGEGFNEFMFEDENGQEKIYLHAEKDHELHIENNRSKRVDNNQSESVGNNKSIEIGNNHHEVIGGNMTLMVGPNKLQSMVTKAFGKFTNKIGDMTNKLGLPSALNMGEGNLIVGVAKNKAETVMISSSEVVGAAKTLIVGAGYQVSVQGMKNESVMIGSYEEVGQNKVVVAGKKMEFVCGDSMIQLNEDGTIRIEGVDIKINGKSTIAAKAGRIDLN
ncbi:MAG: type VI secretion system tip protein TssI/VgrG [Pseudomonadota bacterium]